MKKGLLQLDWVISFGIFVILLLTIFIIFGPALTQEYSDDYLKSIAQKGFKESSFHDVLKYPIFLEVSNGFPYASTAVGFEVALPSDLAGKPVGEFSVVGSTGEIVDRREINGDLLYFRPESLNLGDLNVFYLFYSPSFSYPWNNVASPPGHHDEYNATIGAPIKLNGFSQNLFNQLSVLDYDDFKLNLNYPIERDLSIYVYDGMDSSALIYNYSMIGPMENDDVYVLSWSDNIINESGVMYPILIQVRTW